MKLNHINLGVTDVPGTVALLETYFGLRRVEGMPQTPGMSFVHDDNAALISLFKVNDANYPKIFHIGFLQDSKAKVDEIHEKLRLGGFEPGEPKEEFGRYVYYVNAPGGFVIEVSSLI